MALVHEEVADAICTKHAETGLCFYFHYLEKQGCACSVSHLVVMNTQRDPVATQLFSDTLGRPVRTLRVKMVLLGGSGVGKSSLALRFVRSEFRSTVPTVGCAYMTHMIHLRDVSLRFEIWDTAGQEKYHSVTPLYYRGAHAALLVYDISKRETFYRVQLWLQELEKHYIPGSTVMWLIGNKADLGHARQVSEQEGHSLAADRGLYFIETSALSGDHVDELLQDVAHRVYECVGGQQGGLSEWEEKPCEDLHHRDMSSLLTSCCKS